MQQDKPVNQNNEVNKDGKKRPEPQDRGTNDDVGLSTTTSNREKPDNTQVQGITLDRSTSVDEGPSTAKRYSSQDPRPIKRNRRKTVSVIRFVPDNIEEVPDIFEDKDKMAAQVTVAPEGGWGWIVMVCSFLCLALIDGTIFTYAPLLPQICDEFQISESLAAVVNAVLVAVCFISSPISSALINRFGFRTVAMTGSIISSLAVLTAYFSTCFVMLLISYGIVNGIGSSMIILSSSLIVGFYFEKLRSVVMPIVSTGAPIGTMVVYPINCKFVSIGGWRNTILFHSGIIGLIYFVSLTYRPLPTLTVTEQPEEITSQPEEGTSLSGEVLSLREKGASIPRTKSNRKSFMISDPHLKRAVSNVKFPTAAEILREATTDDLSSISVIKKKASKVTFRTLSAVDDSQFKKIKSLASTLDIQSPSITKIDESINNIHSQKSTLHIKIEVKQKPEKRTCLGRWCDWTKSPGEARPMYRDDAFYEGKIQSLPAYQRSLMAVEAENRTGLEYQLEVSRALSVSDLKEKRGVFTKALLRILATIFDPRLLKQRSFLLFCFGGLFSNAGLLVPYVFIQARTIETGLNPSHALILVSVISFSNLVGRLTAILLALKMKALDVFIVGLCIAGVATLLSGLSNTSVYQFGYCCIYGFCMAHSSLRSVVLVELYGLENLTSCTGICLMFNGVGNLFSTPLASILRNKYGYDAAFYFSGSFITLSGFIFFLVKF